MWWIIGGVVYVALFAILWSMFAAGAKADEIAVEMRPVSIREQFENECG